MRYNSTSTIVFLPVLLAILALPAHVSGHATGYSLLATTSPYVVDVGYDTSPMQADSSVRFDFLLTRESDGDPVRFAEVWVRITGDDRTLLATGVRRQPLGPTTLLYTFQRPGTYGIDVSYRDEDGNELANASFPLSVVSTDGAGGDLLPTVGIIALIAVAGAAVWFFSRRDSK